MDSGKSHGRATGSNFNTSMAVWFPGSNRNEVSRCCRADSKSMTPVNGTKLRVFINLSINDLTLIWSGVATVDITLKRLNLVPFRTPTDFSGKGPDTFIGVMRTNRYCKNGGQRWNRTTDTRIFNPLLYRLSYLAFTSFSLESESAVLKRLGGFKSRIMHFICHYSGM